VDSVIAAGRVAPRSAAVPQDGADAADLIVSTLEQIGVGLVFGVPGGAVEPLYNALARSERRGGPRAVVARHEAGAAFMADGYARETGRIGACVATSGPGATNLITGVACAYDNRVPMLVITGQPPIHSFGRRALQESSCTGINTVAMFRHCTRYNSLVSHPDQLRVKLFNALMHATREQGPSHLSIPVDLLRARLEAPAGGHDAAALLNAVPSLLDPRAVDQLQLHLVAASRPVFLLGDGCAEAAGAILKLAHLAGARFITTPDAKGYVNPRHPSYCGVFGFGGHASADDLVRSQPDLLVAFGTAFGEFSSGGWSHHLLNGRLVHVDSCDENLMRTPMARLHVRGRILAVVERLLDQMQGQQIASNVYPFRDRKTEQAHAEAMLGEPDKFHSEAEPIKPQRLMNLLSQKCPPHTRFVADAGNSAAWAVHCLQPHDRRATRGADPLQPSAERRSGRSSWLRVTMDFAPMGWAIGAAIGIAEGNPGCPVVCITGDGSYLMNGQEITVAAALGRSVLFVVLNDGALGMVKHGQRLAGAEPIGFELPQVDYRALANALGVPGHVVRSPKDLEALDFDALLSRPGPTLLDVRIDPEEVPPMNVRMKTLGTAK
jgi:acetolactate synthase-1/2/3 large subunit